MSTVVDRAGKEGTAGVARGKNWAKEGISFEQWLRNARVELENAEQNAGLRPATGPDEGQKPGGCGPVADEKPSEEKAAGETQTNWVPTMLTDFERGMVSVLLASGISHRQIAFQLKCGRSTIDRLVNLDAEVKTWVERMRFELFLLPLQKIMEHSKTNLKAAIWLAEFHLRERGCAARQLVPKDRVEEVGKLVANDIAAADAQRMASHQKKMAGEVESKKRTAAG